MIHQTYIVLTFILILFTFTTANQCPCELIASENPPISTVDLSWTNPFTDDDSSEEIMEQVATNIPSTNRYPEIIPLYPLDRERKSLSGTRRRFKRPSWAAVGKRSLLIKKRPSWAQVG